MLETTLDAIRAILKADPSIIVRERNQILAAIRNGGIAGPTPLSIPNSGPRILNRKEVAKRLGRSLRLIDRLASDGVLVKRRLPGRIRCTGFLESDVNDLISNLPTRPK